MMSTPTCHENAARPLILLVDDDAHMLALLGNALQAARFDVRLATSAPMAEEMLANCARMPDLAIIDMHMPAMNGMHLVSRVNERAPLPFLMMSASDSELLVRRAAEQGAVGYLVKPVELQQLLPAVITGIARGQEIRNLHETGARLTTALLNGRETAMAVGMVMERFHVDRDSAFGALRQHARSNRLRLVDVVTQVLTNGNVAAGIAQRLEKGARTGQECAPRRRPPGATLQ